MTQTEIAKEWENFLKDYETFMKEIEKIANKSYITKKDRLRVKIMLEILLDEYKLLKPSLLLPEKLKKEAQEKYKKIRELYEKLFTKRSG